MQFRTSDVELSGCEVVTVLELETGVVSEAFREVIATAGDCGLAGAIALGIVFIPEDLLLSVFGVMEIVSC